MLILSNGSGRMIIFDTAELELMKEGSPIYTPHGDTFGWTADPVWLTEKLGLGDPSRMGQGLGLNEIVEAIEESQKRPEANLTEEDAERMCEQIEKARPHRKPREEQLMKRTLAILLVAITLATASADMLPSAPYGDPPHPGWVWDGYKWVEPETKIEPEPIVLPDVKVIVAGTMLSLAAVSLAIWLRKRPRPILGVA